MERKGLFTLSMLTVVATGPLWCLLFSAFFLSCQLVTGTENEMQWNGWNCSQNTVSYSVQVNSPRLKSNVASKWASKLLWGYHLFFLLLMVQVSDVPIPKFRPILILNLWPILIPRYFKKADTDTVAKNPKIIIFINCILV